MIVVWGIVPAHVQTNQRVAIEYGVHRDLIIIYPKPYSIYLRETIDLWHRHPRPKAGMNWVGVSHTNLVVSQNNGAQ